MNDKEHDKKGLVIWTLGHKAKVLIDETRVLIDIPGKWRLKRTGKRPLAPGDYIRVMCETSTWKMLELIERKNEFTRRAPGFFRLVPQVIAANLDLAVVIAAAAEPATPFGLVDRLLVTAELGNVKAALVINKVDLVSDDNIEKWQVNYRNAVDLLLFTSAEDGENIENLTELIRGKTVLFAGSSGVGKSTLANCIDPSLDIKTREISNATGKGRHTTSSSELHAIANGGWLIDTPGLRVCGPWGKTAQNLDEAFPEIRRYKDGCKFRNCLHRTEIGCTVREMIGTPELPELRYNSYLKLLSEAEEEQKPDYL